MKRTGLFFVISLCFTSIVMLAIHQIREKNRDSVLSSQAQIIGANVEEQFADYFEQIASSAIQLSKIREIKNISKEEIFRFYDEVLKAHPSVLGINKINPQGVIDEVYPLEANEEALGKKTQALNELKNLNVEQKVWISNPFKFYQGMMGFGFYVRTSKNEWLAIVITSESFFKKFIPKELGENFQIVFKESDTKREYLRSAELSPIVPSSTVQVHKFPFYNRKFTITIWPKKGNFETTFSWLIPILVSFIISALATLAYLWWNKNNESKSRLEELNQLLRLTIHDTSNSLTAIKGYIEIMKDDPDHVPIQRLSKHVSFIIDVLDQIKVVKQLSATDQEWNVSPTTLLQLVLEVSDLLSDRLKSKKISLSYDPELLVNVKLNVNKSLFSHSVIGNLLSNAIKFSNESSTISIQYHRDGKNHIIEIHNQGTGMSQDDILRLAKGESVRSKKGTSGEAGSGFGLLIVKQVVQLHQGKLEFKADPKNGTTARVMLPIG